LGLCLPQFVPEAVANHHDHVHFGDSPRAYSGNSCQGPRFTVAHRELSQKDCYVDISNSFASGEEDNHPESGVGGTDGQLCSIGLDLAGLDHAFT
jgi:hypothetical protein